MRAIALAVLVLASNVQAGTPGRVAIDVSAGGVSEDLTDLSHMYQMGPTPSFSAAVEVFNKDHWLSLQAGLTYNHNTMTDHTYIEYAILETYTPSVMIKVNPIRRLNWLWAGLRLGAVNLKFSDTSWTQGHGNADGWGTLTQGNVILVVTQHRHVALNLEAGYQFAKLNDITYERRTYHDGTHRYPVDFQLSGPRIALELSFFP
jgi:hypothetical protein